MEKSIEMRVEELEKQVFCTKNVLSFEEASRFLNLSKSYLYKLTSGNLIPHYKPQGKMLYFEREELEAWLRRNPIKTRHRSRPKHSNMYSAAPRRRSSDGCAT